jgi:hypothetical protein
MTDDKHIHDLLAIVTDFRERPSRRSAAADELAEIADPSSIPVLLNAISAFDVPATLHLRLLHALSRFDDPRVLETLHELVIRMDTTPQFRQDAVRILIARRPLASPEAGLERLTEADPINYDDLHDWLFEAIEKVKQAPAELAVPALLRIVKLRFDGFVRVAALEAILAIEGDRALPVLLDIFYTIPHASYSMWQVWGSMRPALIELSSTDLAGRLIKEVAGFYNPMPIQAASTALRALLEDDDPEEFAQALLQGHRVTYEESVSLAYLRLLTIAVEEGEPSVLLGIARVLPRVTIWSGDIVGCQNLIRRLANRLAQAAATIPADDLELLTAMRDTTPVWRLTTRGCGSSGERVSTALDLSPVRQMAKQELFRRSRT